jgi:hypothetical protein
LSCHNADSNGLDVISDADASGAVVPGGFHWRAFGDNKLVVGSTNWNMAVAAMRESRAELDQARAMDAHGVNDLPVPMVARFIPKEDEGRSSAIAWRWGAMDARMVEAIDTCLREQLVPQLRRNAPEPAVQTYDRWGHADPKGSVELHVGEAFEKFCQELEAEGIKMLERAIGSSAMAEGPAQAPHAMQLPVEQKIKDWAGRYIQWEPR